MGYYYVKSLNWKKSAPQWKLQFIFYKNEDCAESKAKKPKKEWDIGSDCWPPLGFHKQMSIEDAKVRAKQLNADLYARKQEKQILVKNEQELRELLKQAWWLPLDFVAEFEARFVRARATAKPLRGVGAKPERKSFGGQRNGPFEKLAQILVNGFIIRMYFTIAFLKSS